MLFFWTSSMSQRIKLLDERKIDILNLWINFSGEVDSIFKSELNTVFLDVLNEFNATGSNFFVNMDSVNSGDFINLSYGNISYSNNEDDMIGIGVITLLIGGHILMIATQGYTIPILPILTPVTESQLTLNYSVELFDKKSKSSINIESSGYFRSIGKQQQSLKKRFRKRIRRILKKIEKENMP